MRMILCDDQELVVLSLTRLFEGHGHDVVAVAHRPAELAELVEEYRPDVCVLEVVTRGDEPIGDAMSSIAAIAGQTDVVVVTCSTHSPVSVAALASGARAVVMKSTTSDELVAQVERRVSRPPTIGKQQKGPGRYFLTEREVQVLESLADGDSTERIGARLNLSHATVRSHVQSLLCKLGVHSRAGAVAVAVRSGLITRCA
ncbi:LuxR C-terminal-related transcriptional regulator [Aquihabitans sp. McL0605]|uniref:LuxR C-terminal-related transcriptional regulator n=1 Tax=Aquihabitans sp. McL0605 TaxID=3415671 RepID=UPI003CF8155E